MNDLEETRKRLKKRKSISSHSPKPLSDKHFNKLYNNMIKCMILILVGLAVMTYIKLNPTGGVKEYILNDTNFKSFTTWASNTFLSFLPDTNDVPVNSTVMYTHVSEDYYKNNSNEVVNFKNGKVIYTGTKEMVGSYVVVLLENGVQVTYSGLNDVFVKLYDKVEQGMVLGTYEEKVMLQFEYLGKEISYETFLGME